MLDVSRKSRLWEPPKRLEKREMVSISDAVLAEPEIDFNEGEDVFRIRANGLDWDIGNVVYEPKDKSRIAVGPNGKKLGIFMTHGGASDWRSIERLARTFCGKRGFKVCSMTYPGRFYLNDPSRDWPDDTFHADGTARTPIWLKGEAIAADEYDVKVDASNRDIYGSRSYAVAKPGTRFHLRMAAWPTAIVEAMKEICSQAFPAGGVVHLCARALDRRPVRAHADAARKQREGSHRHRELLVRRVLSCDDGPRLADAVQLRAGANVARACSLPRRRIGDAGGR